MSSPAPEPLELKSVVREALTNLSTSSAGSSPTTSDLSIDEELALHSIGWEPVELVSGISIVSIPLGWWNWGQGEITAAAEAHHHAVANAVARLHREAARAGGHGVVGVRVERAVRPTHVEVALVGSAVRPVGAGARPEGEVFLSDLSGRDFALLSLAGWETVGLAVGASFVFAPRRSVGAVLGQQTQNVELTNYTEAMYAARETAMTRMQDAAIALNGTGVVGVTIDEGPMSFASHAVGFVAIGTVVRAGPSGHQRVAPFTVVPLDDAVVAFDARSLE
ncbi:MAG TPA: heavy metal-binding domain-containing protein [Acidimicrobiales bacterium]|nr:heavy metal-binding domain-containing protein [Acidimicrobiales bacterium]